MIDRRIAICVAGSIAGHLLASEALSTLPERTETPRPHTIEVRVVSPPPEPEPEPTPEPEPPKPAPIVAPRPQPVRPTRPSLPTTTTTSSPTAVETPATTPTQPVYGVTMESTGGSGPAAPVGNTTSPAAPQGPATTTRPAPATAVPAHEVTKMPMPRGRCSGTYTQAARDAGIEGMVVLDLVVDEHGRTREITVVSGLAHGLTEAAIAALRTCQFDPGERAGSAVPVRVRGFKIRFVLES